MQKEYLLKDKIAKYKNHYVARYDGGKTIEKTILANLIHNEQYTRLRVASFYQGVIISLIGQKELYSRRYRNL